MSLIPLFSVAMLVSASPVPATQETSTPAAPVYEFGVEPGLTWGSDSEGLTHAGPGVRLHLLRRLGPYVALGSETAFYVHAGSWTSVTQNRSGGEDWRTISRPFFQLGAVGRAGWGKGSVRPAFLLGLAWDQGRTRSIGYSFGGEVEVRLVEWLPLILHGRFHLCLHNLEYEECPSQSYVSTGLGTRLSW